MLFKSLAGCHTYVICTQFYKHQKPAFDLSAFDFHGADFEKSAPYFSTGLRSPSLGILFSPVETSFTVLSFRSLLNSYSDTGDIPFAAGLVPVTRHIKIKAEANPFDPEWDDYFETRYTRKWFCSKWGRSKLRRLWSQQNGLCPVCQKKFKGETSIHVHHIVARCMDGGDSLDNLVMLHPNCHRQIHSLMKLGADTGSVSAHLTAGS